MASRKRQKIPSDAPVARALAMECAKVAEPRVVQPKESRVQTTARRQCALAIYEMDCEMAQCWHEQGVNLQIPLLEGSEAMDLWREGCLDGAPPCKEDAANMALWLEERAANMSCSGGLWRPPSTAGLGRAKRIEEVLARAGSIFDEVCGEPMVYGWAQVMRRWEHECGAGRQSWLDAIKSKRTASYVERPPVGLGACLFEAFGKGFDECHWDFVAESLYNCHTEVQDLIDSFERQNPLLSMEAKGAFAAFAIARDSVALLAALASLPGEMPTSAKVASGRFFNFCELLPMEREIPLMVFALGADWSKYRSLSGPASKKKCLALISKVPEMREKAQSLPVPECFAFAKAVDVELVSKKWPFMLAPGPCGEIWAHKMASGYAQKAFESLARKGSKLAWQFFEAPASGQDDGVQPVAFDALLRRCSESGRARLLAAAAALEAKELGIAAGAGQERKALRSL